MGEKTGLEAVIDWVQITIKDMADVEIIERIFQFPPDFMSFEGRGRFRYAGKWSFGSIELLTPPDDYPEMGCHIYLTGTACREMEIYLRAQKRTWFDFFRECLVYGGNFSRLDLAIDDTKTYFKIKQLGRKVSRGECVSKFRNWSFVDGGTISGEPEGCTLNLGSRQSKCSMVFYEKNYERSLRTGVPLEFYGDWNRYEIRLRQEAANNCVRTLAGRGNICFIGLEVINYYVRMVVPDERNAQRSRWELWKPWERFLEGVGQLKLSMRPAPRTLEQKKQWVEKYVAPTLKMIQMADDNLGEEFLKEVIQEAQIKEKQRRIVEDYLIGRLEAERQRDEMRRQIRSRLYLKEHGFVDSGPVPERIFAEMGGEGADGRKTKS